MELWIARDKDGLIHLFIGEEPLKGKCYFKGYYSGYPLGLNIFHEVTWENSPKKVELKIID